MIYLIICEETQTCKIGFSNNPEKRLKSLQTSNPYKLILASVLEESETNTEKILHSKFKDFRVSGEWFNYNKDILDYFINNPNNISKEIHIPQFDQIEISSKGLKYLFDNFNNAEIGRIVPLTSKIRGAFNVLCNENYEPLQNKEFNELTNYSINKRHDFIRKLIGNNIIHIVMEPNSKIKIKETNKLYTNYILFNPYIAKRDKELSIDCYKHFKEIE